MKKLAWVLQAGVVIQTVKQRDRMLRGAEKKALIFDPNDGNETPVAQLEGLAELDGISAASDGDFAQKFVHERVQPKEG